MPTARQLDLLWEADLEFGLRRDEYAVQGSDNQPKKKTEMTGEIIGTIRLDEETGEIIIEPIK